LALASLSCGSLLLGLLGEKYGLDVWKNATLSDGDSAKKLVQLLIVSYSQLQVTGDDPGFLVVSGSVTGQFKDFSAQILENCSQVHWSTSTNTLSVVAFAKMTMDTTDGELKPCAGRSGLRFGSLSFAFASARHFVVLYSLVLDLVYIFEYECE
jgi:hypothetical protein